MPLYENSGGITPKFPPAVICEPYEQQTLRCADSFRKVTRDINQDASRSMTTVEILNDSGKSKSNIHGLIKHETNHEWHTIDPSDPLSAHSRIIGTQLLQQGKWKTLTETSTEMWCDQHYFHIKANLKAYKNDSPLFERSWERSISRQICADNQQHEGALAD